MQAAQRADPGELTAIQEWKRGWLVVLAAAIGYGTGGGIIMMQAGLFIKPMRDALGWSTAAVTIAPIFLFAWAICYPLAGAIIDRYGSRKTAIAGVLGLASCIILVGVLPISRVSLYSAAVAMGVFASISAVPTYTRGVASWFKRGVGLAFGIALSGSVLIAIFATPMTGFAIAEYGWRAGFLTLAGIMLCLGLPAIIFFYRENPEEIPAVESSKPETGISRGEALRDARFWCYVTSFTLACIALGGTLAHLQPLLAEKGYPLATALSLGVLYAIAMSAGKILGGLLLDRFWPYAVAALLTLIAAMGSFGLAMSNAEIAYPIAALLVISIGSAQGAESDFTAFFILRSFGIRAFSSIVAVLAMIVTFGLTVGSWFYGIVFDIYGSYDLAINLGAVCLIGASIIVLIAGFLDRNAALPATQAA